MTSSVYGYVHFVNLMKLNSHHFIGYIAATASGVQVFPTSLIPCHTSGNCTRYLRCIASTTIKWHYPNSTVIISTHTTTKIIQGDDYQCSHIYNYICTCSTNFNHISLSIIMLYPCTLYFS